MEFRKMARVKQQLPQEKCIEILENELRGVLSVLGDGGYPYGMPINHFYDKESGNIYFHGGRLGHRIDAIKQCDKVSFCVYDSGYKREGEWALNISSVIVFGRLRAVDDFDRMVEISKRLSRKFTSDEEYIEAEVKRSAKSTLLLELTPEHITGKLVNEA